MTPRTLNRDVIVRSVVIAALLAVALFVPPATLGGDWIATLTSVDDLARPGRAAGDRRLDGDRLSYLDDLPFPLLLLATGVITCVLGVLIGLPALRLSGLYLALITLMVAGAITVVLGTLDFPNGGGGFLGHPRRRPRRPPDGAGRSSPRATPPTTATWSSSPR